MKSPHPAAAGLDYFAEIAWHSDALATAAEHDLDARVAHCPGWTVADLVEHLWQVHWFWSLVAEQRPSVRPDLPRPNPPARDQLIASFRAGAARMVGILSAADQLTPVWTWAPSQQDIAFISRHQVQEAAVHHWDAEHAVGRAITLSVPVAVDSIEEMLTFSVATAEDPAPTPMPGLGGSFGILATDVDASWTISDAEAPGTLCFDRGHDRELPVISASASDLLLWLYRRVEIAVSAPEPAAAEQLITRFRALSFTD